MAPDLYGGMVVVALAAARIYRLLAHDEITGPLREGWLRRVPWLDRMLGCPWCTSVWVASGLWAVWLAAPQARPWVAVLAVWQLAGWAAERT